MEKVLIAFATKTGTAMDAAKLLGEAMTLPWATYDCRTGEIAPGQPLDLGDWDAVVLGTAMYMGKPLGAMRRFCTRYESELMQKPLFFYTCGVGTAQEDKAYLLSQLPPSMAKGDYPVFHLGGEIREDHMNFFSRMAMREYVKQHGPATGILRQEIERMARGVEAIVIEGALSHV